MPRTVLLVSRDDELQYSRSVLLQNAGYRPLCVDSVGGAVLLAAERPQIAILCSTLSAGEQEDFIERVRETDSSIHVLCLRSGSVAPAELIEACEGCYSRQPGMAKKILLGKAADA